MISGKLPALLDDRHRNHSHATTYIHYTTQLTDNRYFFASLYTPNTRQSHKTARYTVSNVHINCSLVSDCVTDYTLVSLATTTAYIQSFSNSSTVQQNLQ